MSETTALLLFITALFIVAKLQGYSLTETVQEQKEIFIGVQKELPFKDFLRLALFFGAPSIVYLTKFFGKNFALACIALSIATLVALNNKKSTNMYQQSFDAILCVSYLIGSVSCFFLF